MNSVRLSSDLYKCCTTCTLLVQRLYSTCTMVVHTCTEVVHTCTAVVQCRTEVVDSIMQPKRQQFENRLRESYGATETATTYLFRSYETLMSVSPSSSARPQSYNSYKYRTKIVHKSYEYRTKIVQNPYNNRSKIVQKSC